MKLCSVLTILILSGRSKRITSKEVIGSWWSIEVDLSYSETYVNEVDGVYNHEDFGPFSYKYTFYSDSICIGVKKWPINVSDTSLVLSDHQEKFILYKLPLKESIFESRKDNLAYDNFHEEFRKRCLGKLKVER